MTGNEVSPLVDWLLRLRGLADRLQGRLQFTFAGDKPFLEGLYEQTFVPLAESAGSEIVFGVVGKFWEISPGDWPDIGFCLLLQHKQSNTDWVLVSRRFGVG